MWIIWNSNVFFKIPELICYRLDFQKRQLQTERLLEWEGDDYHLNKSHITLMNHLLRKSQEK